MYILYIESIYSIYIYNHNFKNYGLTWKKHWFKEPKVNFPFKHAAWHLPKHEFGVATHGYPLRNIPGNGGFSSQLCWRASPSNRPPRWFDWRSGFTATFSAQNCITGWWFQTFGLFSISYMGCHPSHWRTHTFQDAYCTTIQSLFLTSII